MTPGAARTRGPSRLVRVVTGQPATISLLAGALAWELVGRSLSLPFLPPLTAVGARMIQLLADGTIPRHLAVSLFNLAIGYGICIVLGNLVGILMGLFWRVDAALSLWVMAFLTTPALVLAPIFFSIFGLSTATPIAIIVFYSLFIVIINARAGVQAVRRDLVEMALSFNASRVLVIRLVILPATMPYLLAGMRLGAGQAVKGMVNGEMFIAVVGLGGVIVDAGRIFDSETVLAVMIVVIGFALVLSWAIAAVDNHLTAWLPVTRRT